MPERVLSSCSQMCPFRSCLPYCLPTAKDKMTTQTHWGPTARLMSIVHRVVSSSGPVRRTSCSTKFGWNTRFRKAMLNR